MPVPAHIGNVPVEEWLPFLVPVVALYVYGRHRERRRRSAVDRLPDRQRLLDEGTTQLVLRRLAEGRHGGISGEYLPVLYPPGPDGMTAQEIANHSRLDSPTVERLLEALEELGYVEPPGDDGPEQRVWLTVEGYDLVNVTESALLAVSEAARGPGAA
jgi:DNA-binding transcriptional ArsR family regulator